MSDEIELHTVKYVGRKLMSQTKWPNPIYTWDLLIMETVWDNNSYTLQVKTDGNGWQVCAVHPMEYALC